MKKIILRFLISIMVLTLAFGQERENDLQIIIEGSAHFIVKDFAGRRTGFDPRTRTYFNEIPGASYGTGGVGSEDPSVPGVSTQVFGFGIGSAPPGEYTVTFIGEGFGQFKGIIAFTRLLSDSNGAETEIKGVIDWGQIIEYSFLFSPNVGSPLLVEKAVAPSTLRQDFDNSFKLKLIGEQGFYKELSNHLDNYEKHLAKKDSLKAAREVEKFQSRIRNEYLEAEGKDKRFATQDGWEILNADAQYVIEHLVNLPPKPTGALLRQIDELKTELTRQSSKKNIGGALLVKSLTFLVDQAKKQLQKPLPLTNDSAVAAFSIAAFQLFVDEVWELTAAISGKNKNLPALYIYDEAYIQLHYRAKYILEALPAPRTLIDMKSVQMDDDIRKEFDAMKKLAQ